MNRIEERMSQLDKTGEKALVTYITAGLPDIDTTIAIVKAQEEAGVDVVELGIPFSDPVADGPVIQKASYEAIQSGINIYTVFELMERLRIDCNVPIIFMTYYNTIYHYGLEEFCQKCVNTGVDGLIVPDLPYEEQQPLMDALKAVGDGTILIQLVSPVSSDRIPMILKDARGFVYCVSSMGVTGKSADFHKDVRKYLTKVRENSTIKLIMGFGVRTAQDVLPLADMIDGVVVGSAFIRHMEESRFRPEAAGAYVAAFKKEFNEAQSH